MKRLHGLHVIGVGLALAAGCSGSSASGPHGAGAGGAPGEGGAPATGVGPAAGHGSSISSLEVRVVDGDLSSELPLPAVLIGVEGADGQVVEGTTDSMGTATLAVDPASAPWTVTAARPRWTVVTIVGVTGPLHDPIALLSQSGELPSRTRTFSGRVTGLAPGPVLDGVYLWGPDNLGAGNNSVSYEATIADWGPTTPLRLLATDSGYVWPSTMAKNAVWVDIDRSLADLSHVDIAFPTPARQVTTTHMTVRLPTSGAVDGRGMSADIGWSRRVAGTAAYTVGVLSAQVGGDGVADVEAQSFDGDMVPTHLQTHFAGPGSFVNAWAPVTPSGTFDVPAAEVLSVTGTSLADVRVSARATAYGHVGAVLWADRNFWHVYSYGAMDFSDEPWPKLPTGVTMATLGFTGSASFDALAITVEDGTAPWGLSPAVYEVGQGIGLDVSGS